MSQLEIQILHQDYLLTCPDGHEAQLLEAVERVDQQFQKMRDTSKLRSRERVGVLLAVNLAYENLELRNQLQALQLQLANVQDLDTGLSTRNFADIDRLQAFEAQAYADQTAAQQLITRLDAVLTETAEPEPESALSEPLATTFESAALPEVPDVMVQAIPDDTQDIAPITTKSDNESSIGWAPGSAETL